MLKVFLILIYFYYYEIIADNKSCRTCKYFIPFTKTQQHSFGFCRIFPLDIKEKNSSFIYELTVTTRNNENLCGVSGFYYTEKLIDSNTTLNNETSVKKLLYDYSLFLRQVHDENNEM